MSKQKRTRSLRFKITALAISLIAIPAAISLAQLQVLTSASEKQSERLASTYAESLIAGIKAQFYERYGDVQTFALNPHLQKNDHTSAVQFLNKVCALYGIYDLILFVGVDGKLKAVNDHAPDGQALNTSELYGLSYADTPWFQAAMKGNFSDDKENGLVGTYVEDPSFDAIVSQVYGKQMYGNSFTSVVRDDKGEVVGVLTNRAGFRWVEAEFEGVYERVKDVGLKTTELTLLSKDGAMLVDHRPHVQNGENKVPHDPETLGKYRPRERGYDPALRLFRGESGNEVIENPRTHDMQLVGFAPLKGSKFVSSLGWGILVKVSHAEAISEVASARKLMILIVICVVFLAGLFTWFFAGKLNESLLEVMKKMLHEASAVSTSANVISESSQSLASGATEQEAAVQQTVSSVQEISAMVRQTSENADQCKHVSETTQASADEGQRAVQEMLQAINEMSASNRDVLQQVQDSHRQMNEIAHIISEISTKTKIINDIVFQTRLLSFNASVEAARAGEHGKGFAVVAEEVGNLAQMSGSASQEIDDMLQSSLRKVESIMKSTQSRVQELVETGRAKMESSVERAQRCNVQLTAIMNSVHELDAMIMQIASASKEQAQGVNEIANAMSQVDRATSQNAEASTQSADAASKLHTVVDNLQGAIAEMGEFLNGTKRSPKVLEDEDHSSTPRAKLTA